MLACRASDPLPLAKASGFDAAAYSQGGMQTKTGGDDRLIYHRWVLRFGLVPAWAGRGERVVSCELIVERAWRQRRSGSACLRLPRWHGQPAHDRVLTMLNGTPFKEHGAQRSGLEMHRAQSIERNSVRRAIPFSSGGSRSKAPDEFADVKAGAGGTPSGGSSFPSPAPSHSHPTHPRPPFRLGQPRLGTEAKSAPAMRVAAGIWIRPQAFTTIIKITKGSDETKGGASSGSGLAKHTTLGDLESAQVSGRQARLRIT